MSSNVNPPPVAHAGHRTYDGVSRSLHWLTLSCVLVMFVTGWGRGFFPPEWRELVMPVHISTGLGILFLTLLRLAWRPFRKVPPPQVQGFLHLAATLAHLAIYAFMIGLPLCGWIMVSAFGHPPQFAGLVQLPALMIPDRGWGIWLKASHAYMAYGFAALIGLHAVAALMHHYLFKDETLVHMLPLVASKRRLSKTPSTV